MPIQAQVTIELTGRMLPGTEIGAALAAIDPLKVDIVGINCATGPVEMSEHLRHLSQHSRMPISCLPNAGLPSVVDGKMHYDLTAEDFVAHQVRFVSELGVQVVGGCCGTTPDFIAKLVDAVDGLEPAHRTPVHEPGVTSIYSLVPFDQDTAYLGVGERTNANGSKKFREAMLDGDWDLCLKMATDQVKEGAHVLDVCVDYVGRDGTVDMEEIASRFATQVNAPLMVDSTEANVVETALQWIGGRPILNSVNLEDGDAPGTRFDRFLTMARDYGAAVVCTCIDETGQARTPEWKLAAAKQIHDLAIERYGLEPSDLIFDPLALTLATGIEESRNDGANTIEGIRLIKEQLPGVHTTLGLSNISFGLNPAARHVLNSVFLHECTQAGLDSAIVHASKIQPLNRIPDEQREVCLDLIYDRRGTAGALSNGDAGYDPLQKLLELFANVKVVETVKEDRSDWTIEQRLSQRIIDGDRDGLEADLDEALSAGMGALAIVNDVLLAGMKVVGDLFGSGEMQLPFVLQSAETMKASVAFLEPHMEKSDDDAGKGRIVLATVKGDVHDIGKNLVDIILTNNGYEVHNIGIKVSISDLIAKAVEVKADAIGMSGLLVKSTLVMRDNLEELNSRDLSSIPVVLGGAALTRSYVERDLREVYDGRLFYGKDAFEGLHVMDRLGAIRRGEEVDDEWGTVPSDSTVPSRLHNRVEVDDSTLPARSPEVATDNPVFKPPFTGPRMLKGVPIDEIASFLNETSLFRNQWQYRPEGSSKRGKAALRSRRRDHRAHRVGCGLQGPHPPDPARAARPGAARGPARAGRPVRLLPVQRRWPRPGHLGRRVPDDRADPVPIPPAVQGPVPVHRGLRPTDRLGRDRLRRVPARHDGPARVRAHRRAVRGQPVQRVPAPARARRRDGRGHGRAGAQADPQRVGLRRRGRPHPHRAVSPAVPGRPLLMGLPGLPGPRGQPDLCGAARRRGPRHRVQRGHRLPVPPGAVDRRGGVPPPQGQVLRRPVGRRAVDRVSVPRSARRRWGCRACGSRRTPDPTSRLRRTG